MGPKRFNTRLIRVVLGISLAFAVHAPSVYSDSVGCVDIELTSLQVQDLGYTPSVARRMAALRPDIAAAILSDQPFDPRPFLEGRGGFGGTGEALSQKHPVKAWRGVAVRAERFQPVFHGNRIGASLRQTFVSFTQSVVGANRHAVSAEVYAAIRGAGGSHIVLEYEIPAFMLSKGTEIGTFDSRVAKDQLVFVLRVGFVPARRWRDESGVFRTHTFDQIIEKTRWYPLEQVLRDGRLTTPAELSSLGPEWR